MTTQTLNINLIPGGVPPRVNWNQYDRLYNGLIFNVYNGSTPFTFEDGMVVSLEGRKPDGNVFQYSAEIRNNQVVANVYAQMTVYPGEVICEIVIRNSDGEQIGTGNFVLNVEAAPLNDEAEISDSELPLIEKAVEIAPTIIAIGEQVQDAVDNAEGYADIAKSWAQYSTDENERGSDTNNAHYYADMAATAQTAAAGSAQSASESAESASESASAAAESAQSASTSETNAGSSASAAAESAQSASTSETNAGLSAAAAAESSDSASASADNAADSAGDAEAWARGTRNGTDVSATDEAYHDNAYYWKEEARRIADSLESGVASFNGRTGVVMPVSGDYSADMIEGFNEYDSRLALLEKMLIQNQITAPIQVGTDGGTILLLGDTDDTAITAGWKYEYQ